MTIVDSSVWIDFISDRGTPHAAWLRNELERDTVGLTDLILYELLQGVRSDVQFEALRDRMSEFAVLATITNGLEVIAANNSRQLRSRGVTVRKTVDCLIATFCIEGGHALLHNDRDFDGFERYLGLMVIHPEKG